MPRQVRSALLVMLAALLPAAATAHVVVLRDGTKREVASRPIIAFGTVRWADADGRVQVLQASEVDLAATRSHPSNAKAERVGSLSYAGGAGAPTDVPAWPARSMPSVTMYSATWCGVCTNAKKWLAARGVPVDVIEVDRLEGAAQEQAKQRMSELAGRVAYPVIVVGNTALLGFRPQELARLLPSDAPTPRTGGASARK